MTGAGVLLIRTSGDPVTLSNAVRNIFREQDPLLAVFGVESLDQALSRSISQRRFAMLLVTAFAGVALLLAGIGVYGVFNYDVAVRRRELSIRIALGAARGSIVRLVVNHALVLIALALAIGVSATFGFTTFLSSLLFGVRGTRSDHDARCGRASCRDCDRRVGVAGLARVTAGSISDTSGSGLGPAVRSG